MPPVRAFFALAALSFLLLSCRPPASPDLELGARALPAAIESERLSFYAPPARTPLEWPTRGWKSVDPASLGLDPGALSAAVDPYFVRQGAEKDRVGVRTDGIVVIYHGLLVHERYAGGYGPESRHLWWSVAKSVGNALAGIAVKEGRLALDEKVSARYPPLGAPDKADIRVDDLLRMSSGLYSSETYESSFIHSTVNQMLFTIGSRDMGAFAASQPKVYGPGAIWEYSSLTPNLFSAWLSKVLGADYADYPWKRLFEPLGMSSAVLERDVAGTYVLSSYLYASARDMAKFGWLFLNDGAWEGGRILPEGWVSYTTTPAPAWLRTPAVDPAKPELGYGAYWWLNRSGPGKGLPWPSVPEDAFAAEGHWGQYVVVVPSRSLVVALESDTRDSGALDMNRLLAGLIASGMKEVGK